jgi:hypothetical protein
MYDDRRCSNRLDYAINVTYKFNDGSTFKVAKSKNINENGMSLRVDKMVKISDSISFMIDGYEEVFEAKVVWCKREAVMVGNVKGYQVGITYEEGIAERVNEILREIIDNDDIGRKRPR